MQSYILRAMRRGVVASIALGLLGLAANFPNLGVETAHAQNASQCGFIQNADRRNMCRARAESNASHCGFIQNSDLRNMCRAQVTGERSSCGFIRDADMRNECNASL